MMDINHLANVKERTDYLKEHALLVGVPTDNDKLTMIALVQEMGKHIEAKNYPYLVIPTSNAQNRKASQIVGLYRRGHALGIDDESQPNGFRVMFVLRKSVDIPSRPFIRFTLDHYADSWAEKFADLAFQMLLEKLTPDEVLNSLGKSMVKDMQMVIDKYNSIPNAPLTEERKGFNNPLIDTGNLRDSIDYLIIKK